MSPCYAGKRYAHSPGILVSRDKSEPTREQANMQASPEHSYCLHDIAAHARVTFSSQKKVKKQDLTPYRLTPYRLKMLKRLGCRRKPGTDRYEAPREPAIRRFLQSLDGQAVDPAITGLHPQWE